MSADFTGVGWAFPLGVSPSGGIAMVSGDEQVAQAIRLVLGTAYGERPMRPEFGCAIHDLVFATADPTLAGVISREVTDSLRRWEPRIEVTDVVVEFDPDDPRLVEIDIHYVLSRTNDPRNLVVPFYAIPEDD